MGVSISEWFETNKDTDTEIIDMVLKLKTALVNKKARAAMFCANLIPTIKLDDETIIKDTILTTLQSYESICKVFLSKEGISDAAVECEMKSRKFWSLYFVLFTHIDEHVKEHNTLNDQHH